jgi:hypothetical protein
MIAFASAALGRFKKCEERGTAFPKMPLPHIWNMTPKQPAVIGVAEEVPPKELVYALSLVEVVVNTLS